MLAYSYLRSQFIDYCTPLYVMPMPLMTSKPKPLPPAINVLRPFSPEVWIMVLLGLLVATVQFVLIGYVRSKISRRQKMDFANHVPLAYTILVNQGSLISYWSFDKTSIFIGPTPRNF